MADTIIIDTGAGISDAVVEFLVASGEILLVTTPEPTSITDSYSLLKALNRHPRYSSETTSVKVIANKVSNDAEGEALFSKLKAVVVRYLRVPITYLGMIPQDQEMEKAVRAQKIVSLEKPNAVSSKAFKILVNNYINDEHEAIFIHKGITQLIINFLARKSD